LAAFGLSTEAPERLDRLGLTADTLATVRLTFLLVAAVALVVGALGILNIGLVALRERVEEIALRRATGALALQIGLSVLAESVLAALTAACLAGFAGGLIPAVRAARMDIANVMRA
jgi:putative ABC transport system permease protein